MKTKLFLILLLIINSLSAQRIIAIKNISIIPMNTEIVLKNKTVIIKNGIIYSISDSENAKIPKKAIIIDGTEKYLMPGLFDMHAHFFNEQGENKNTCEAELKIMLANGLTTARIMAGHPNYLDAKNKVKSKKWIGPNLVVASPQFAGKWPWSPVFKNFEVVDTPEQAIDAVKRSKKSGYDAIKITFMLKKSVFEAIIKSAKEENIKVVGHVGPQVKLPLALKSKMQIEHLDEFIEMLLPDSTYNKGQSVSDMNLWRKNAWETIPVLDESKITSLAKNVKEAGIFVTPTNYFFISCFGSTQTEADYKNKPDFNYIPTNITPERFKIMQMHRNLNISKENLDKYVYLRKKMTYELWKAGVPLMAGSDSPEWFLVTGFSIHDELKTFVESGLTPFAALQTATVNTANYLEMKNKGTIEINKIADLILLNKNPLENIANTKTIETVIKNGKLFSKENFESMLKQVKNELQINKI